MILGFTKGMDIEGKRIPTNFEQKIKSGEKIHTIRVDEKSRWKQGNKIHFATGVRSSNYNCFKHGTCSGVQQIEIDINYSVKVDGNNLNKMQIQALAWNDGFISVDDFKAWFKPYLPFQGKLIHWTERRY